MKYLLPKLRGRTVVLLGQNVAGAFGAKGAAYMNWYEMRNPQNMTEVVIAKCVVIPHPSGVNRHYNRPSNRDTVAKFLRGLADQVDPAEETRQLLRKRSVDDLGQAGQAILSPGHDRVSPTGRIHHSRPPELQQIPYTEKKVENQD